MVCRKILQLRQVLQVLYPCVFAIEKGNITADRQGFQSGKDLQVRFVDLLGCLEFERLRILRGPVIPDFFCIKKLPFLGIVGRRGAHLGNLEIRERSKILFGDRREFFAKSLFYKLFYDGVPRNGTKVRGCALSGDGGSRRGLLFDGEEERERDETAGDQDADQRDHNGGLDIRSLLPCGFLKAVSTLVLPAQIQVVDMDVLSDIRFVRLQINLGAAVFTGDKALLHAVRNMQCSVAVRALDFGNLHVSPSLDQLMNDR